MNVRTSILILFLFLNSFGLFSQVEDENMPKVFYRNEKTIALNLLTNGWGLGYRYGDRINFFEKRVGEYSKAGVGVKAEDQVFTLDADFC